VRWRLTKDRPLVFVQRPMSAALLAIAKLLAVVPLLLRETLIYLLRVARS
jgi:hypothetical protein